MIFVIMMILSTKYTSRNSQTYGGSEGTRAWFAELKKQVRPPRNVS